MKKKEKNTPRYPFYSTADVLDCAEKLYGYHEHHSEDPVYKHTGRGDIIHPITLYRHRLYYTGVTLDDRLEEEIRHNQSADFYAIA